MRNLQAILQEYSDSHQNSTNQKIHKVCVPLIEFSILGLLMSIPTLSGMEHISWADVLVIFALVYYAQFRNWKVIAGSALMALLFLKVQSLMAPHWFWPNLVIFVIAWIGQFIGHKIEGKKPSFFKDVFFLLIGPLWVLKSILDPLGIKLES
jgi:uncharacterized membrane protein YGL010W